MHFHDISEWNVITQVSHACHFNPFQSIASPIAQATLREPPPSQQKARPDLSWATQAGWDRWDPLSDAFWFGAIGKIWYFNQTNSPKFIQNDLSPTIFLAVWVGSKRCKSPQSDSAYHNVPCGTLQRCEWKVPCEYLWMELLVGTSSRNARFSSRPYLIPVGYIIHSTVIYNIYIYSSTEVYPFPLLIYIYISLIFLTAHLKSQVTGRRQAMQPAGSSPSDLLWANSWRHRRILKLWESMDVTLNAHRWPSPNVGILWIDYVISPNFRF